jgi:hypothetical protein
MLCRVLRLSLCELIGLGRETVGGMQRLSEYVREIRTLAQLSPAQLDDRIGFDEFVSKLESGSLTLGDYPLQVAIDIALQTNTSRTKMIHTLENSIP